MKEPLPIKQPDIRVCPMFKQDSQDSAFKPVKSQKTAKLLQRSFTSAKR